MALFLYWGPIVPLVEKSMKLTKLQKRLGRRNQYEFKTFIDSQLIVLYLSKQVRIDDGGWVYMVGVVIPPDNSIKTARKWWSDKVNITRVTGSGNVKALRWAKDTLLEAEKLLKGNIIFISPTDEKRASAYRYLARYGYEHWPAENDWPEGLYKQL